MMKQEPGVSPPPPSNTSNSIREEPKKRTYENFKRWKYDEVKKLLLTAINFDCNYSPLTNNFWEEASKPEEEGGVGLTINNRVSTPSSMRQKFMTAHKLEKYTDMLTDDEKIKMNNKMDRSSRLWRPVQRELVLTDDEDGGAQTKD